MVSLLVSGSGLSAHNAVQGEAQLRCVRDSLQTAVTSSPYVVTQLGVPAPPPTLLLPTDDDRAKGAGAWRWNAPSAGNNCPGRGLASPAPRRPGAEGHQSHQSHQSRPGPRPHSGRGRRSHAPQALTSCCEEQGAVERVGCQPFPLQGTKNKRKTVSRGALLSDPAPAQGVPGTDSPPRAPEAETGTDTGAAGQGRGGLASARALPGGRRGTHARSPPSRPPHSGGTSGGAPKRGQPVRSSHQVPRPSASCTLSAGSGVRWGDGGVRDSLPKPPFLARGPGTLGTGSSPAPNIVETRRLPVRSERWLQPQAENTRPTLHPPPPSRWGCAQSQGRGPRGRAARGATDVCRAQGSRLGGGS